MEEEEFGPEEILEITDQPQHNKACQKVLIKWEKKPKEEAT